MRVLLLGGTRFIGRRIAELLLARGDAVTAVHRGVSEPEIPGLEHLHTDRADLHEHAREVAAFGPDAVVDAYAMTAADVDTVRPVLAGLPAVVLSSQDIYAAIEGLRGGFAVDAVPITEESALRTARYPYRGSGLGGVPDDYEKLDVEERWAGATVLRLPMVYGPHDPQRRESPVLRIRAGRSRMPVGSGSLLWTRAQVDDVASAVLAALDAGAPSGVFNVGERTTPTMAAWFESVRDASGSGLEFVRVPDDRLPADLALLASPAQHLLVDSGRAERLLGWIPGVSASRVAESVRWHLENPGPDDWTPEDAAADDAALASL